MSKTPEEMAEEYTRYWWPDFNDVKTCCQAHLATRQSFLAGYEAGVKEAEIRILNEFFDNYGAEEHAKFALRVNAYQLK